VEGEAPTSHDQIAQVGHEEHLVMSIPSTIEHAFEGEVHEPDVRQRVDYLGQVMGRIVVLFTPVPVA